MLLCLEGEQVGEDFTGDVALEASDDFFLGSAFGGASGGVGAGAWVAGQADQGSAPQVVRAAVAASVEAVASLETG
jgi:hypothetical protein